jgi:hypothetical protein
MYVIVVYCYQPSGKKHETNFQITVLPAYTSDDISPALPSKEVTKVALRLKYQIEQVIPFEVDRAAITNPNSNVITRDVIRTAKAAGGDEYRSCVVYCLLVCQRWFKLEVEEELWEASLYECRALACEVLAKHMYGLLSPDFYSKQLTCDPESRVKMTRTISSERSC